MVRWKVGRIIKSLHITFAPSTSHTNLIIKLSRFKTNAARASKINIGEYSGGGGGVTDGCSYFFYHKIPLPPPLPLSNKSFSIEDTSPYHTFIMQLPILIYKSKTKWGILRPWNWLIFFYVCRDTSWWKHKIIFTLAQYMRKLAELLAVSRKWDTETTTS